MNFSTIAKSLKPIEMFAKKHSPEILIMMGLTGIGVAFVKAVKNTPDAHNKIEEIRKEKGKVTIVDAVKATWKDYLPSAILGTISVACIVGSNSVNSKRNAALATAYSISDSAFREYKDKVIETIGEKKEQVVADKVAEEEVKKNPPKKNEIFVTGNGDTLCMDYYSGRYFWSSKNKIEEGINNFNNELMTEMQMSVNQYYDKLNLPETGLGDYIGWDIDDGLLKPQYSYAGADDGTPCMVVSTYNPPKIDLKLV